MKKCKIKGSVPIYKWRSVSLEYLAQKVGDKFTKLSKIGLSIEYFTADFLECFTKKRSKFGFWLSTHHQIQAFSGFSWNFLISEDLKS